MATARWVGEVSHGHGAGADKGAPGRKQLHGDLLQTVVRWLDVSFAGAASWLWRAGKLERGVARDSMVRGLMMKGMSLLLLACWHCSGMGCPTCIGKQELVTREELEYGEARAGAWALSLRVGLLTACMAWRKKEKHAGLRGWIRWDLGLPLGLVGS